MLPPFPSLFDDDKVLLKNDALSTWGTILAGEEEKEQEENDK